MRGTGELDVLAGWLAVAALAILCGWVAIGAVAVPTHHLAVAHGATVRFLIAVGTVALLPRAITEAAAWRYRSLPPDERFGFASGSASGTTVPHGMEDATNG